MLGMWLSRTRDGRPKRNLVPAMVIILTGFAMSAHPQSLMISTKMHTVFGYTLMAAGFTRVIEISFVLRDKATLSENGNDPNSFQHLPPFLLYASGFLFMGATEEQMKLLDGAGLSHVSYTLMLYSIAFLLYLFVNMLLYLYAVNAMPTSIKLDPEYGHSNGHLTNGHVRQPDGRVRDAEEFELEGLTSEDEDEAGDSEPLVRKESRRE